MTYKQKNWDLADLFPGKDSPELESAFDQIEEHVTAFEGARGKLKPEIDAEQFLQVVHAYEETSRIINKVYGFASLSFAADTQDQAAQTLVARTDQFMAEIRNRTLFFSLWWKKLDEQNASRLMDEAGDYRYYLEQLRLLKTHTLSEAEEKIVNLKNVTGIGALNTLYDSITNRYTFKLEVEGEVRELMLGELQAYRYSPDPDLRARSYQEQLRVFGRDGPILGQMYQTLVRDWHRSEERRVGKEC
jgi:oligoendopeptidase F